MCRESVDMTRFALSLQLFSHLQLRIRFTCPTVEGMKCWLTLLEWGQEEALQGGRLGWSLRNGSALF